MVESTIRRLAKTHIPQPIRRVLRGAMNYARRVGRWSVILWQIRGASIADERILIQSALAAPILSFRNLLKWQDPVLLGDAKVRASGIGTFHLRARTDDLWHVMPGREPAVLGEIRNRLFPGATFVDAGANIGIYSVLASSLVGESGRVLAVEMMPATAHLLREHLQMNGATNAVVINKALANSIGDKIPAFMPEGQHGQASIVSTNSAGNIEDYVETTTLDAVLSCVERVDLLKMDLEGAEDLAISGLASSIDKINAVIFEDWGTGILEKKLGSIGFSVKRLDGRNFVASRSGSS